MLFFSSSILGSLITISSYSWMGMWMGLEINLLSITPLLSSSQNSKSTEAAIKYFITQVLASNILLLSIILLSNQNEQISNWSSIITQTALFTKMGAAPFHMWFPEVMKGLSWMNCLMILTWQKIAPMVILMKIIDLSTFVLTIIITSLIIGTVLGLNQVDLRKIMAYSSINHIGWMISAMISSKYIWIIYFSVYSAISISIIMVLSKIKISHLQQITSLFKLSKISSILFSLNFLSLGGIPPFLGFLPKWLIVQYLILSKNYLLSMILVVTALIALIYYLRMVFVPILLTSNHNIHDNRPKINNTVWASNLFSIMSLPLSCFLPNLT
uniref:NADH-ubiquinone oxidoreductase chain 2 n=2 Tax=Pachybrachis TaxID=131689 RepID=A0A3G1GSB5_9CUCU|nr:NADH dehydrogenase subunit 2 [Pachybrachis regius]APX40694.1 NADH dehydrogenase subunit 2 [Pachybrachis suffrianii]